MELKKRKKNRTVAKALQFKANFISFVLVTIAFSLQQQAQSKPTSSISTPSDGATNFDSSPLASQNSEGPIRAIHYHFDQKMEPSMQLNKFNSSSNPTNGNNVTCNDGSPAGYYKRLNVHSKSWIIYLQGGGYCGSEETCQHRWRRSAHLMSSNFWPQTMSVDGILSSEPKDNPYLWNANHIYVPYCSSDSWTGLQEARADQSSFAFMGSKIIEKVLESLFDDLPRESSLFDAKFILFAGDSAGATGVILNLDKLNRLVQRRFSALRLSCSFEKPQLCEQKQVPIIRGLADSGWFLDNEPYDMYQQQQQHSAVTANFANEYVDCDRQRCSPLQAIKQAALHWNGQVPPACATKQPSEPWRCYFAHRAYSTLRTPLFVVQWLYDEAQLMVDNIVRPGTVSQWNYVNKLVSEMRASLENVSALFAPSCFSHSLIIKQSWNQININGFKLPHVLNSWEEETLANQPSLETLTQDELAHDQAIAAAQVQQQFQYPLNVDQFTAYNREQLFDRLVVQQQQQQYQSMSPQNTYHHHQLELRSAVGTQRSVTNSNSNALAANGGGQRTRSRKKKRNNNNHNANKVTSLTNRLSRSTIVDEQTIVFNNNVPDNQVMFINRQQDTSFEKFRLIDTCGWPQCNRDCPNQDLDFSLRPMSPY